MTLLSMSALLSPGKSQFTDKSRRAPRIKGSSKSQERDCGSTVCLKTKIKSNQIKSLLLSHHHSTSALVSEILTSVLQTVQTTTIYIWTVHIYRLYRRQCAKYTYIYSVHIVYYRDILNYQLHIIHHMGTSTLCTLSIHYVVYT